MKKITLGMTTVVTLLIPFFLVITSVRILLNPWYLQYQYTRPGFPQDDYGFTTEDRLNWGGISLDYLVNDQDISFLARQEVAPGMPLYNERELSHMLDVKNVVQTFLSVWWIVLVIVIAIGFWLWQRKQLSEFARAISRGSWLTIFIIVSIIIYLLINFDALFENFHALFFEGDSWLFNRTDTLLRLFPLPLWQDAFIFTGAFSALMALLLGVGGWWAAKRTAGR